MIEQYQRVYASVNLDAIHSNMDNMKANLNPETRILGIIKTDGYGHGAVPIAKELEPLDYMYGFGVATYEEAMILRKCGITKPILIIGYTFPYSYEGMAKEGIRPSIFRMDQAIEWSETGKRLGIEIPIHIKVDTGMQRIGICGDEEGFQFIKKLKDLDGLEIEGIFTHFSKSDFKDKSNSYRQLKDFQDFNLRIKEELKLDIPIKHTSNSAGLLEIREANMDIVRAGIAMYGLWPSDEVDRNRVKLTPALELKSHVIYVKDVEAGESVSYGGIYTTTQKTRIATIPVGYGDGYPRSLSNKGFVLLHGKRAPIIGRICMDQFMVDVSDIPETKEGDLATLIGRDGAQELTLEELGDLSGRFNYEFACDLGKRIPRIYLKGGKVVATRDYFHDYQ